LVIFERSCSIPWAGLDHDPPICTSLE
jgi:hypothetical protein